MRQPDGTPASAEGTAGALEEYLAAAEAGTAPPREEFLARHPELAEDLDACLGALRFIGRAAEGPRSLAADVETLPVEEVPGRLGDFRIVREVGRGGMGVVYEAEQVSLGRRVALKVLPFAATMDPRQLQRFHNEARAAASLDHPHIVHVHAVGCERAVHFYAMQFIEGQPLSALIREMRQPGEPAPAGPATGEATVAYTPAIGKGAVTESAARLSTLGTGSGRRGRDYFRKVAELGEQAAEALDHAHQAGIVHRDVKPGNLLLDGSGRLWVTDFGLAHVQQGGGSLTMTGDLVGTLRYMSPEQALAKRVPIDHRTDVYSLGATLYELLTLRPAFEGADRQELLRQIAFEEPKAPRRIDKVIPAELETIVLKALEKNPADRYATAQEMADDLRRWLADKPIRARRPSWRQVGVKWARRHRAAVWAAAVVLLVACGFGVWRLQQRAAAEAEAETALKDADVLQQQEKYPEALFTIRRAEPLLNTGLLGAGLRRRVQERLEDLKMVDRLEQIRLDKAAEKDDHFDTAQADPAYAQAFRDYGIDVTALGAEEAAGRIGARGVAVELAAALDDWSAVCWHTRGKGDSTWKELLALARAADPDEMRNRLRDAVGRSDAQALKEMANPRVAEKLPPSTLVLLGANLAATGSVEQAVAVIRKGQRRYPGHFWINHQLGTILLDQSEPAHREEAVAYYMVAVALRPSSPGAHSNLGLALKAKGQLDAAIAEFREAIQLKKDCAVAHCNLGWALHDKGQLDEAIAECREAIRLKNDDHVAHDNLGIALYAKGQVDEAIAVFREAIRLQTAFPLAHYNLGNALHGKGQVDEAIAEFREAIRLQKDLPKAHYNLGNALSAKGQLDEAIAEFREAIRLKKDDPNSHINLGIALYHKGQLDEAIAEYREAIRIKKDLPEAHDNLGIALYAKGQVDEAIAEHREAIRLKKDLPKAHNNLGGALCHKGQLDEAIVEFREAIRLRKDYAGAHYNLANALNAKGQLDDAIAEFREAIRLNKDGPESHCNLGQALLRKGQFQQGVEEIRIGHQLGSRNPRWSYPSAQWLRQAEQLADLDARLPQLLQGQAQPADAGERLALASLCQQPYKQLYAAAARWYAEAFAADRR